MWEKRTRKEFLLLLLFTVFYIYPTLFTFFHRTQRNSTISATCNTHFPTCNTVATKTPEHKRNTVLFIVRGGKLRQRECVLLRAGPDWNCCPFPPSAGIFFLSLFEHTHGRGRGRRPRAFESSPPSLPCESGGLTPRPRWGRPLWGRRRRLWGGHWRGERLCNMWRKRELGGRGVKRKKELHKEVSLFGTYFNWRFFCSGLSGFPPHHSIILDNRNGVFEAKGNWRRADGLLAPNLNFSLSLFFTFPCSLRENHLLFQPSSPFSHKKLLLEAHNKKKS